LFLPFSNTGSARGQDAPCRYCAKPDPQGKIGFDLPPTPRLSQIPQKHKSIGFEGPPIEVEKKDIDDHKSDAPPKMLTWHRDDVRYDRSPFLPEGF
jgi:hypothetical protein